MSLALERLAEERKIWRKDHPFGFFAKPVLREDGSMNLLIWECGIPGRKGTPWENGLFKLKMHFSERYPIEPPHCVFTPPIFHPNIYSSGGVCLSILKGSWKPAITVKEVLIGIQELLDNPNPKSPANHEAYQMFRTRPDEYLRSIAKQVQQSVKEATK